MKGPSRHIALAVAATGISLLLAEGVFRLAVGRPAVPQIRSLHLVTPNGTRPLEGSGITHLMVSSQDPKLRELRGILAPGIQYKACYAPIDPEIPHIRPSEDNEGCVTFSINSDSLRGPLLPQGRQKPAFRIAAVGDSFTFGDGVSLPYTWLAQLESRLNTREQNQGDLLIETVNLGVPGYGVKDAFNMLEGKAFNYSPDLILYGFFLNDALLTEIPPDVGSLIAQSLSPPSGLAAASAAVDWIQRQSVREEISRRTRLWYEAAYDENSETWEICSRYLRRMAEVTRREKIPLVVLLLPPILKTDGHYPYGWIHDQVIARLDELGVQSIDLRDVFDGQEAEKLWVHPTDHHPNELAHRLIAAHIGPLVTPLIQKSR